MASTTLAGCVSSLRTSMQLLDSSISILDSGVSDFNRLSTVLQTTRHFELLPQSSLAHAQSALHDEIAPEIDTLLACVEAYVDKLARRERGLIAKCELQEGRLSQTRSSSRPSEIGGTGFEAQGQGLSRLEEVKVQQLKQKKERLSYAVGRLELQASQRERQLRKSMAFQ